MLVVSRSRVGIASPVQRAVVPWLVAPPAFIMTRALLVNLKRRADAVVLRNRFSRRKSVDRNSSEPRCESASRSPVG
jgi:hypothetical protein